ncbi:MAG: hypothetical protein K0R00_42 [Herbinix sp.]|jgi:hypothetical protein|nr:hypothetical protein [Herbinix sp.]
MQSSITIDGGVNLEAQEIKISNIEGKAVIEIGAIKTILDEGESITIKCQQGLQSLEIGDFVVASKQ